MSKVLRSPEYVRIARPAPPTVGNLFISDFLPPGPFNFFFLLQPSPYFLVLFFLLALGVANADSCVGPQHFSLSLFQPTSPSPN